MVLAQVYAKWVPDKRLSVVLAAMIRFAGSSSKALSFWKSPVGFGAPNGSSTIIRGLIEDWVSGRYFTAILARLSTARFQRRKAFAPWRAAAAMSFYRQISCELDPHEPSATPHSP